VESVEHSFYVNNCLQSLPSAEKGRDLVNGLRQLLATGGFEITSQKSSRTFPPKSDWKAVNYGCPRPAEMSKSQRWAYVGTAYVTMETSAHTMRNLYKVLASQYDPLVLIQCLWKEGI